MKRQIQLFLTLILLVMSIFSACDNAASNMDLMYGVESKIERKEVEISKESNVLITDFAVRLFQHSAEVDENTLISPLSVISALAMTANGAEGNTLSQMEDAFGFSIKELNQYLYSYTKALPTGDKYKLNIANSIWFKDDKSFTVEPDFCKLIRTGTGRGSLKLHLIIQLSVRSTNGSGKIQMA